MEKLIVGEYYWCIEKPGWDDNTFIFIVGKENGDGTFAIRIEKGQYYRNGGNFKSNMKDHRLATYQERQWLDLCISAGKYVEMPEIKELYTIF